MGYRANRWFLWFLKLAVVLPWRERVTGRPSGRRRGKTARRIALELRRHLSMAILATAASAERARETPRPRRGDRRVPPHTRDGQPVDPRCSKRFAATRRASSSTTCGTRTSCVPLYHAEDVEAKIDFFAIDPEPALAFASLTRQLAEGSSVPSRACASLPPHERTVRPRAAQRRAVRR